MDVPLYLMMSYAYYQEDKPIATDATFDIVAKMLLESYDKIKAECKKANLEMIAVLTDIDNEIYGENV